ncbi:MAG: DUF2752 domain-containing protein [Thermoanaerobaculia bacterium]|nr:DUF2752 domain-containing protein [Thermoanaerobaculia bacterium]
MSASRQLGLLWGGVAAILVAASPAAPALAAALPRCPFLVLTGLPCPGCGSARAALALAAFDPVGALLHNPLAAVGWATLVLGGVLALGLAAAGHELPRLPRRLPLATRWAALLAVAGNWAYLLRAGGG